jgi:aryl-alcohol dehydrogenase-like predicted oxidoreductase
MDTRRLGRSGWNVGGPFWRESDGVRGPMGWGQLRGALTRDGRSMTQAALSWIVTVSDHTIPIPGFKTVAQVEDLVSAADLLPLDQDQLAAVDELAALPAP